MPTLLLGLSALITACGGGGSNDSPPPSPPPVNASPTANAGSDQSIVGQATVTLAGSGTDSDGTIATISWAQTAGAAVTLSGASTYGAQFTSPLVTADTVLE